MTAIDGSHVWVDLMRETLRLTNLGAVEVGDRINIERAARFGDEIGGHAMSGHVVCMAELVELEEAPNNRRLWFSVPAAYGRFLFDKGYVGVDGISLTIGEVRPGEGRQWPALLREPDPRDPGTDHAWRSQARRLRQYRDRSPDPGDRRDGRAGNGPPWLIAGATEIELTISSTFRWRVCVTLARRLLIDSLAKRQRRMPVMTPRSGR